ncbi:MAG TPA: site-specific DNA-methyltransferase [Polyangiaceae bacterium]|nr:site-specific DNA-methyltransferase [Polyangiaceae bacterium]
MTKRADEGSTLILGDNLDALRALAPQYGGGVTLAYLDPPFLTGRLHERVTRVRDSDTGKLRRTRTAAFDDRWQGLDHYLEALGPRLVAVRELLAPHGSVVLHVDSKTSHYAKVLCDEIFGPRAFASEIVWRYRRWPTKTPNFQRLHDVLLRYVKDPDVRPRFRQLYEPLAPSTVATWGRKRQRAVVDDDGRRTRSSTTEEPTPGAPLGDVWDIGIVAPVARERTGYPTQKPEVLLERLVEALTDPGELVVDPYVGSGTTAAVCARLGRRAIGIDSNPEAVEITRRRLAAASVQPTEVRVTVGPAVRQASRRRPSRNAA